MKLFSVFPEPLTHFACKRPTAKLWARCKIRPWIFQEEAKGPQSPPRGPAANRDGKGRESVSSSEKAHNGASKTNHPKGADIRNDTTGKTRGKHYSMEVLRRMFEAYERNLCRKT